MPTSRQRPGPTFDKQAIGLAAGAWAELGVSGWQSTHSDWAIDPEPLILFTAWLGDRDPRLRDEATDWCIRNWRHISRGRLKNLLGDDRGSDTWREFAGTLTAHSGVTWPDSGEPRAYKVTGRSTLAPLTRPSTAWLRLRAMFGLGARSEILRCFLSQSRPAVASVALLAAQTGYQKRNVSDECEMLERAGVLSQRVRSNRFYYSLGRRSELESFLGDLPSARPPWTPVFEIAKQLVLLEKHAETLPPRLLAVRARQALTSLQDDLDELDVEDDYRDVHGEELWPAVQRLGASTLTQWSVGTWPEASEADARPSTLRLRHR